MEQSEFRKSWEEVSDEFNISLYLVSLLMFGQSNKQWIIAGYRRYVRTSFCQFPQGVDEILRQHKLYLLWKIYTWGALQNRETNKFLGFPKIFMVILYNNYRQHYLQYFTNDQFCNFHRFPHFFTLTSSYENFTEGELLVAIVNLNTWKALDIITAKVVKTSLEL